MLLVFSAVRFPLLHSLRFPTFYVVCALRLLEGRTGNTHELSDSQNFLLVSL